MLRKVVIILISICFFQSVPVHGQSVNVTSPEVDPDLESRFLRPPATARPWVYWMWLLVDSSEEAITIDLEEMKAKGIEGAILYNTGNTRLIYADRKMVFKDDEYHVVKTDDYRGAYDVRPPFEPLDAWGDRSLDLIRHACQEADRLGIKLCLCVGLAGTSGPITPKDAQQKLVWSEYDVSGSGTVEAYLPVPVSEIPSTWSPKVEKSALKESDREGNERFKGTEIAVLAVPDKERFSESEIIDLSSFSDKKGFLRWNAPAGRWKIMRFAYVPTGHRSVWGLYTDMMSREALEKTWDATIGKLLAGMTSRQRRGLYAIEEDSWEARITTWTKGFDVEFRTRRDYDLVPLLPALAGETVGDHTITENIRRDYYRTIADLIAENHYFHLRRLAERQGLLCYTEPCGPNTQQLDYMYNASGADFAMGEFWIPSPHRPTPDRRFMLRNAASANHIYGKKVTPCEGFTACGLHWEDTFFGMKSAGDQAFADGCNLMMLHCYSHSPSVTAKPGYVYFAGTHYTRQTTWWEQTPAFNTYLARCSYLLQQGLFVADALYFRGDSIGFGEARKTRPALPKEGYDHDNCNLDVFLNRLDVRKGRLVLPDTMSYRFLVLPDDTPMRPEVIRRLAELLEKGAIVVGPKPRGVLGHVTAEQKKEAETTIEQLWNGDEVHMIGSGRLYTRGDVSKVLADVEPIPDFQWKGLSKKGCLDWIHRRASGTDIYFVANLHEKTESLECSFRVDEKQPEIWDPVTGKIRPAAAFRQEGGRTVVPLTFHPRESLFVVFRRTIPGSVSGKAASNEPVATILEEITGPWSVRFDPEWRGPGEVVFDELVDWTKRNEVSIRHYSGTAVYRKKFIMSSRPEHLSLALNLGEVREIASVRLNGIDLGVLWTKPFEVDVTDAIKTGENILDISVVNLWPNRMILDEQLPKEERFTESNIHKFVKDTPLLPSGLIGPVTFRSLHRD